MHTHGYNPALTADGAATGNHTAESSIMNETILYHRNREYIPRIAAVHDMCGYGKCSLTAAIPILSADRKSVV